MGGSPVAAHEASDDDDDAGVAVPVAGSHVESASNTIPAAPGSVTPVAEGDQERSEREAPAEAAPAAAAEAKKEAAPAAAGVEAMAVTVVRDVEMGLDVSSSDQGGNKPSWFTPKR
jgi:hypothetical protein